MIVNVKRKELLALVKKVARAAPSGDIDKAELKGILVEADERTGVLRMTATNFEIAIQANFPAAVDMGGSVVIEAKLFLEILSLMPGENLYLELKQNNHLFIQSEATEFYIAVLPGEKYPKVEIPYPGETVLVTGLKSLVNRSAFAALAASKIQAANPVYGCVNLILSPDGIRAVAGSNSGIVQVAGDENCQGQVSLLIPASSLKTLASLSQDSDVYEMGITGAGQQGKNLVFFDGSMIFAARLIDGRFMDTDKVFHSFKAATTAGIKAEKLQVALENATATATSGDTVELSFKSNGLFISCETNAGYSSINIEAAVDNPLSKVFHFSARHLTDCIRTLGGDVKLSLSAEGNLLIQNGGMMYLQPCTYAKKKKEEQLKDKTAA